MPRKTMMTTREQVDSLIKDGWFDRDSRSAALVVLSSMKFGQNRRNIQLDTGVRSTEVGVFVSRLEENGILKNGKFHMETDPNGPGDDGDQKFCFEVVLIILLAQGILVRVPAKKASASAASTS